MAIQSYLCAQVTARILAELTAPATTMAHVRYLARKAIRRQFQAAGLKLTYVKYSDIVAAANEYAREHPELIAEAIEAVRNVPQLRTLAEREQRKRKGNRQ